MALIFRIYVRTEIYAVTKIMLTALNRTMKEWGFALSPSRSFICIVLLTVVLSPKMSTPATQENVHSGEVTQIWQTNSYGGIGELKLEKIPLPVISKYNDVLVMVEASSVNPIDTMMTKGYGSKVLNVLRRLKSWNGGSEFPLTLGRDYSGVVVSKGAGVSDEKLRIGDQVWGVIPVEEPGCHATHIIVNDKLVSRRPTNLTYIEATSVIYTGLTAWSALWFTGGLCCKNPGTKLNILILGGSGGVGSMAIQLVKAWGHRVVTTCSADAVENVRSLGADVVINYKANDSDEQIKKEEPFDIIFDCAGQGIEAIQKKGFVHNTFISLDAPLLKNFDERGLIIGGVKSLWDLVKFNIPGCGNKSWYKWGFFTPSPEGIQLLHKLVESGQLKPVVQNVHPFEDLPKAYEQVDKGHLRGKIVIDMKSLALN